MALEEQLPQRAAKTYVQAALLRGCELQRDCPPSMMR
jgi:hypothetical protein